MRFNLDRPCGLRLCSLNADGRYQVFLLAYNQFGYTRSEASNVVTVGIPSSSPLDVTATDGAGQIGISFASAVSDAWLGRATIASQGKQCAALAHGGHGT